MVPTLFCYELGLIALVWLFLLLCWLSPHTAAVRHQPIAPPKPPQRKRSTAPEAFAGLVTKPHCALCEREAAHPQPAPPAPHAPMPPTNRRPRTVDASQRFCPHAGCRYRGWLGRGNLRANGHTNGGPWRPFQCTACEGYFPQHHGTLFHGKHAEVDLSVRVLACLAEGLGIRATARVFEGAPTTVLQWLIEAAEQLRAFSAYFLCNLHLEQLQLDEFKFIAIYGMRRLRCKEAPLWPLDGSPLCSPVPRRPWSAPVCPSTPAAGAPCRGGVPHA